LGLLNRDAAMTHDLAWASVRSLIDTRRVAKADYGDQQDNTHTFFVRDIE
jgi:hypothetical protein